MALVVGDTPHVVLTADKKREDVLAAGYAATAHCGFSFSLKSLPRPAGSRSANAAVSIMLWPGRVTIPCVAGCRAPVAGPNTAEAGETINGACLVEGPLRGDYSIAIVNRSFTEALVPLAASVGCHFDEGDPAEDRMLQAMPVVASRFVAAPDSSTHDVHSFDSWPPDVTHMRARLNVMHCYAWEESEFPQRYVDQFNQHLDLICVASNYTRMALEGSGVTVPMVVIGIGADHILRVVPEPVDVLATPRFRFLHVSSCFPRKGADVLLRAFAEEFGAGEPVELLIKTFHNPHNTVEAQLAALRAEHSALPAIRIATDHLDPSQVRWLYESSQCVVLPSRGEGFLLPAAEAMLLGIPVITTAHGGQLDFCSDATCWLVDALPAPAQTHMELPNSLWAEPDLAQLRARMREVYSATKTQLSVRCQAAQRLIASRFSWSGVGERFVTAVNRRRREIDTPARGTPAHRLAVASTWNQRCGIAVYSGNLIDAAPGHFDISVLAEDVAVHGRDEPFVERVWQRTEKGTEYLCDAIARSGVRSVLIQHHPGFISWEHLARVVERARGAGVCPFVEFHSTREGAEDLVRIAPALAQCGAIFVHTAEDVVRLGALAQRVRVVVVPLGVSAPTLPRLQVVKPKVADGFHVGSFGFLMPHKGVAEHLEALHMLRRRIPGLRATLLHALHDDHKTISYGARCFELRERLGLADIVDLETRFLSIPEVWSRLAACDVLVFPYKANGESASAAIRSLAGLRLPIIISPANIFEDMRSVCHVAGGETALDIAAALHRLATDERERDRLARVQAAYVEMNSWARAAGRIFTVIERCAPEVEVIRLERVA